MAGKGKASKTKLKDKKKTSSQTSGATIKDEMLENQDTEPRFGFMMIYGVNFSALARLINKICRLEIENACKKIAISVSRRHIFSDYVR